MRFEVAQELQLFAESIRGALAGWEAPLEPAFGLWQDDRDDELGARLVALGWAELWSDPALLGPAVAGGIELGRVCAPVCLVDEPTLGAPLSIDARLRHLGPSGDAAAALPGGGLLLGPVADGWHEEVTLDGTGTVRDVQMSGEPIDDAAARWQAWSAATLGYLAGIADGALGHGVEHVRGREQFGAPLASLPAVQARLADAAVATDGLRLVAWQAAAGEDPRAALAWAGPACREVTAHVQQVHGGIGFALEGGIHRFYRRAKSVQVWIDAVLLATA